MRFKYFAVIPIAVILLFAAANFPKEDVKKEEILMDAILAGLKQLHYDPQSLDDDFSKRVYDLYLKRIDSNKRFLTSKDIASLKQYEDKVDDEARNGTYLLLDKSIDLLEKQTAKVQGYYKELLSKPFDFTRQEEFESDPDKLEFASNDDELREYWRKSLKYQVMTRIDNMEEAQKDKEADKQKSFKELEKEARKKLLKIHDDWFHRIERLDRDDRLSAYLNAVTAAYDPHTNYMPPKDKADFDIDMSGRLEGIGARLVEDGVYTKVTSIVPGGPSYKQGELKANDLIIAVGQGDEDPVDVVDMPVSEVVKYIRGKKGTEVRLTVKKPDGSNKVISITRDIVVLEESYAKSAVITDKEFGDKKFGFIHLPKFYADFTGTGGRSCAKDVKQEISKLKEEGVDGIILDLRYNGGGSLRDVVDMAGLFIKSGPIVQVKSRGEEPYVMRDRDPRIHYSGPLVVLVNNYSASASEILAAALQDYHRAVIVGSPSTFGKGTVQRFLDLDRVVTLPEVKPLGAVKMTIQKFYRIDGSTTQLKGVVPDVILPDTYRYFELGEKEEDYPMAWDEIPSVNYEETPALKKLKKVVKSSEMRVRKNETFQLMEQKALFFKERRDDTVLPLNLEAYKEEGKMYEEKDKEFKAITKTIEGIDVKYLNADKKDIESSDSKKASAKEWHKAIKKDAQVDEALAIINDLIEM